MHTFKESKGLISADQRAKDQRATHQPDNFKSRNNLFTINNKLRNLAIVALNPLFGQNKCVK
jgi:hypothetical protein